MRRTLTILVGIAGTAVPAMLASTGASAQVNDLPPVTLQPTTTTTTAPPTTTTSASPAVDDEAPAPSTPRRTTTTTDGGDEPTTTTTAVPVEETTIEETGALSIAVAEEAEAGEPVPVTAGELTTRLGTVTVTDTRSSGGGWRVVVEATPFVTGDGSPAETIEEEDLWYWSGPATRTTGTARFLPGQPTAADAERLADRPIAFSAEGATGPTTASWVPTIIVRFRDGAVSGEYQGTITHSIA